MTGNSCTIQKLVKLYSTKVILNHGHKLSW